MCAFLLGPLFVDGGTLEKKKKKKKQSARRNGEENKMKRKDALCRGEIKEERVPLIENVLSTGAV